MTVVLPDPAASATDIPQCHPAGTVTDYLQAGAWRRETALDLFTAACRRRGDAPALSDPSNLAALTGAQPRELTWSQLDSAADTLAAQLLAAGIRPAQTVAILLPNSVDLILAYLALWRIGAVASPMPMVYRAHEISRIVAAGDAVGVLTVASFGDRRPAQEIAALRAELPGLLPPLVLGPTPHEVEHVPLGGAVDAQTQAACRVWSDRLPRSVNDRITICWTSGTEAAPKGVPRCHGDWLAIGQATQDGLQTTEDSVIVAPFPVVNMAGFATSLLPWLLSASHLVMHHPLDLAVYLKQIQDYRATHASMPPAILAMLLERADLRTAFDLSSLRKVGSGGAPLPPPVVAHWQNELGIEVLNFFGSNEGVALLGAPSDTPDPWVRAEFLPNYGAAQRRWATPVAQWTSVRLVDPATGAEALEDGQRGELRLKGPTVFAGYLPGTADEPPFDEEGYLRTGDVFEFARQGEYLKFVDRSKEIIIRGGMNIAPAEVESLLIDHPAVSDIAVVGFEDPVMGEKCCAVVVPSAGAEVTLDDLVSFLRDRQVATFKLPERLLLVDTLPRNQVGKLQRRDLRAIVSEEAS